MKLVEIISWILFLTMFLFGNIKVNGKIVDGMLLKAVLSAVYAIIIGFLVGLPISAVINLFS